MSSKKKLSSRAAAWLGAAALLVFLGAAGLASQMFASGRIDLTRDGRFTLAPASRKALRELPDILTIRAVMSRDLPGRLQQRRLEAVDLLREFEARSGGKVRLVFEDPGEDPARRSAAAQLGIEEVELQARERGSLEVKKGYFGLALLYGDRKEVIPVIANMSTFEYDLVVRMKKVTGAIKTVGIAEGPEGGRLTLVLPGEGSPTTTGFEQNYPTLKAQMDARFRLRPVDLAAGPVDTSLGVLLVTSPGWLEEPEKYRLDQFLMAGKPVLFLSQGMNISMVGGLAGAPSRNNYEDLLAHYGAAVSKNVVLEPFNWEEIRYGSGGDQVPYPYWMVATYKTLNAGNPVTAKLQRLSFPWTSSLELNPKAQPQVRTEALVKSTPQAWEETGNVLFNPRPLASYQLGEPKEFTLAALLTGTFTSRYASGLPAGITPWDSATFRAFSKPDARLLVVGNALFATDFYMGYTQAFGNVHFVLNALDHLTLDADLIRMRSREAGAYPLDEEAVMRLKTPLLLVNMLLAPLILLAIGIFAGIRRRKLENA
jgi:ABC-type uncharacterized transport system involved in gliding motility auxiliary subunit